MTGKAGTSPQRGQQQGAGNPSSTAAPSPTPTIRPPGRVQPPSPLGLTGLPPHTFTAAAMTPQRALGRGRPRPPTDFGIGGNSQPQTPLLSPEPPGMAIPRHHRNSTSSAATTDDEDPEFAHATPRNTGYFPAMETRRVSEMRGLPSGAQSPVPPQHAQSIGSIGHGRAPRPRLPGTAPPSASVSRSASRVRLPQLAKDKEPDVEDDELNVTDRGEELIRRRLKERKRAKRERERRLAELEVGEEGEEEGQSAPNSAATEGSLLMAQPGASPARGYNPSTSASRHRAPSGSRLVSGSGLLSPRPAEGGDTDREYAAAVGAARPESVHSRMDEEEDRGTHLAGPAVSDDVEVNTDGYRSDSEGTEMDDDDSDDVSPDDDGEGVTVKDRQDAINIEHPFGLPIWKPALYRKSRSVTRNAEAALHSAPAAGESHLLVGNVFWFVAFGWWLALACFIAAMLVTGAEALAGGRGGYGKMLRGLAWYIGWPFGKYVEGEGAPHEDSSSEAETVPDEENAVSYGATSTNDTPRRALSASTSSSATVRQPVTALDTLPDEPTTPQASTAHQSARKHGVSFAPGCKDASPDLENVPLLGKPPATACYRKHINRRARLISSLVYWPVFILIVAPLMLLVCIICWFLILPIPMAKLNWELLRLLWTRPLEINFRPAPKVPVYNEPTPSSDGENGNGDGSASPSGFTLRRARLHAGQVAPTAGPTSTVLLCTYRAVGLQYYKYTVGGVNIMFINLMPVVFFAIIDGMIILPAVERRHEHQPPLDVPKWLDFIANPALVFLLGLASVIPLSYFIGMAVASISAQSSIGMGAVINATFGSIIEIVLYSIALTQGKGRLVEGSIVGSILAGVLLMPGASMCSGALKRKEQKFNAKSAGVTSTMLIMAIIGVLTPTMIYQSYGNFQIRCEGCPGPGGGMIDPADQWKCDRCWYQHPEPTTDPFYQNNVKVLMYICAGILLLSYLIGLWFSLRTHASQIWQNPQQLLAKEAELHLPRAHLARITPAALGNPILPVHSKPGSIREGVSPIRPMTTHISPHRGRDGTASPRPGMGVSPVKYGSAASPRQAIRPELPVVDNTAAPGPSGQYPAHTGYTPYLQAYEQNRGMDNMQLGPQLTQEDFRRAVHTLAAVTALQRQGEKKVDAHKDEEEGGGHEAPSWTRGMSAAVLLGCTLLYAMIAEVLVDVVDVVLHGSGVDEKFLGLTLFALVPNTTEFMNAMSFAMNGNIALSMEIGSAYALQVCLLQIPAMVAFSAWYNPFDFGDEVDTFTLIFPRWDVIAIILGIFLLTYTYIEARSNYHRGSILVLSYCVLVLGFYFAPVRSDSDPDGVIVGGDGRSGGPAWATAQGVGQSVADSMALALTKLWA